MQYIGPFALSAALLLAACAPSQDSYDTAGPNTPVVTCNAAEFDYLIGQPIETVATVATPLTVRVLAATDFVPKDYNANRLTFTTSPTGMVSRVFCG